MRANLQLTSIKKNFINPRYIVDYCEFMIECTMYIAIDVRRYSYTSIIFIVNSVLRCPFQKKNNVSNFT